MDRRRAVVEHEADLLRLLVRSVTDYAVFTLDVDGRVLTWNPGAERLKGYTEAEALGLHFSAFYPAADIEQGKPDRELAIAVAEGSYEDEGWRIRKDGSPFWATVAITALRGDDGRLIGFGKVTRDLTERKQGEDALRESEERFRLLVASVANYAIFLLDGDGIVTSWNLGAERLKGYRADEIIGHHFSRFYTTEDRRAGLPATGLRTALEEGRWDNEGWRVRKDGSRFWADVVITALRGVDGKLRGFAKVTRDLTERKRNEDALRGILERERDAASRLRELDRMKTELVAVVAHDLREPVGVIESYLHVVRTEWAELPDDERLELLDRATARCQSLGALVEDVFDLARIEAGELSIEAGPLDLVEIVGQVALDMQAVHPGREIITSDGGGGPAIGDERRARQVLVNLVSNALKFSPPGEPVQVRVERVAGEIVVSVIDRGPGIPTDEQHLLFQRFVRLSPSAGAPGSGLGLFIARSLAEAQRGRLWVESTPGSGSTFRFSLPAADGER